jgi:hypothetical protein
LIRDKHSKIKRLDAETSLLTMLLDKGLLQNHRHSNLVHSYLPIEIQDLSLAISNLQLLDPLKRGPI